MIKRKLQHKILRFHKEFPNRCICFLLKGQTINEDDFGNVYANDIKYYTKECEDCGFKIYDGPVSFDNIMPAS